MVKRSYTSNPAVIELEHEEGDALRSSKRRAVQVASNTAAMSLLALRTELPTALSAEVFPLNKPPLPLQLKRQAKAVKYSVSVSDDEDEHEKNKVIASKKRPDAFHAGPSIIQLALREPTLCIASTIRRVAPCHRKLPFGRPLPPAPLLPSLLVPSRGVIPSTNKS
jgi:hypothetical protein